MSTVSVWAALLSPPPEPPAPHPGSLDVTADELLKLKQLDAHFSDPELRLPNKEKGSDTEPLADRELMFLSKQTFSRFLKATKGDLPATIRRLEECTVWRRTARIDDVEWMAGDCEPESRMGKNMVLGFTHQRQPVVYFFPNRNTTPVEQRRAIHAVFMLERARDLMTDGVTKSVVVFNFSGKRQGPPTSIGVARTVLGILSAHYPETLGTAILLDLPFVVRTFVNFMWPFVDPVTKKKVRFGTVVGKEIVKEDIMAGDQLLIECGGNLELPYDHEKYWHTMVNTCLEARKRQDELWQKGERLVGRDETGWKRASVLNSLSGSSDGSATAIET